MVVTYTERPPRENEIPGVDYHFLSSKEFESKRKKNEFLETAFYSGYFYGSTAEGIAEIRRNGKIPVLIVNPEGAESLRERQRELLSKTSMITIFITPEDQLTVARRLYKRDVKEDRLDSENLEGLNDRLDQADKDLAKIGVADFVLVNRTDKLEESVESLNEIVARFVVVGKTA